MKLVGAERPKPGRTLALLSMGAIVYSLAQSTILPALNDMQRSYHTSANAVAWTLTSFLVMAAVATPIVGRLGDMFGKRRLLVISMLVFAVGSVISATAPDVHVMIVGRVISGVAGGIFPLSFGIIRDEFPRERVAGGIGLISATAGIGGGLGFIVGGALVDHVSFRAIFWLSAAAAIAAAVATTLFVPESPVRNPARIDLRGAAVFAVGIILPLVGISQAHAWGFGSGKTLGLVAAGLVVLAGWVVLQRRTEQPLADVTLLARPPVLATNVATMLMGFGMFAGYVLVPQLSQTPRSTGYGLGLDPTLTGLVLLPGALIMLVAGPLSGKLATRFAPKLPFAIGGFVAALGLLLLGFEHSSAGWIVALNLFNGFGVGMAFAAMPNLIVKAVPLARTGEATGFNALVRSVGMSIGSQVAASILASHVVGGYSSERGFAIAFVLGAVMCCIAGFAVLLVPSARRAELAEIAVAERRAA